MVPAITSAPGAPVSAVRAAVDSPIRAPAAVEAVAAGDAAVVTISAAGAQRARVPERDGDTDSRTGGADRDTPPQAPAAFSSAAWATKALEPADTNLDHAVSPKEQQAYEAKLATQKAEKAQQAQQQQASATSAAAASQSYQAFSSAR